MKSSIATNKLSRLELLPRGPMLIIASYLKIEDLDNLHRLSPYFYNIHRSHQVLSELISGDIFLLDKRTLNINRLRVVIEFLKEGNYYHDYNDYNHRNRDFYSYYNYQEKELYKLPSRAKKIVDKKILCSNRVVYGISGSSVTKYLDNVDDIAAVRDHIAISSGNHLMIERFDGVNTQLILDSKPGKIFGGRERFYFTKYDPHSNRTIINLVSVKGERHPNPLDGNKEIVDVFSGKNGDIILFSDGSMIDEKLEKIDGPNTARKIIGITECDFVRYFLLDDGSVIIGDKDRSKVIGTGPFLSFYVTNKREAIVLDLYGGIWEINKNRTITRTKKQSTTYNIVM